MKNPPPMSMKARVKNKSKKLSFESESWQSEMWKRLKAAWLVWKTLWIHGVSVCLFSGRNPKQIWGAIPKKGARLVWKALLI